MEIETSDILFRYLRTLSDDTPRNRILWTVALFIRDDVLLTEALRDTKTFDTELLDEMVKLASPVELAVLLEDFGAFLPPESFATIFRRAVESTSDIRALRELGLAAACYWKWHPGTIDVPREFVERLLDSPDEDARLVGLKVMRRYHPEPELLLKRIMEAISSRSSWERCGGVAELSVCVADPDARFLRGLSTGDVAVLRGKINEMDQNERDRDVRTNLKNCQRYFRRYDERSNTEDG